MPSFGTKGLFSFVSIVNTTTAASQIMVARNTPDERQGFAQGVLSTAIWGGAMLGNVIGGLIIDGYGYRAAFWFCGILYFFAGFAILLTHDGFAPQFQQLLHRARRSAVLLDSSKLGVTMPFTYARIAEIGTVVSDGKLPAEAAAEIRKLTTLL